MFTLNETYPDDKDAFYALLREQLTSLTADEDLVTPNLANASALLAGALKEINWVGFYLMRDGELVLGPYQGKPACIRIPVGRGVCGSAVASGKTQLVSDVRQLSNYIACDSESLSEIVVPIVRKGIICGVLDIDSPVTERFDSVDAEGLASLCGILSETCDWENFRLG